jgi:hypothetical protein
MKTLLRFLQRLWRAPSFSPEALVLRALTIAVLYAVFRLLGLQEYTSFLSGTSANLQVSWQTAALLGCAHLLLYVAFILLVPISLIAAALLLAWQWWQRRRTAGNAPPPDRGAG